jgi:hypothetical protein
MLIKSMRRAIKNLLPKFFVDLLEERMIKQIIKIIFYL